MAAKRIQSKLFAKQQAGTPTPAATSSSGSSSPAAAGSSSKPEMGELGSLQQVRDSFSAESGPNTIQKEGTSLKVRPSRCRCSRSTNERGRDELGARARPSKPKADPFVVVPLDRHSQAADRPARHSEAAREGAVRACFSSRARSSLNAGWLLRWPGWPLVCGAGGGRACVQRGPLQWQLTPGPLPCPRSRLAGSPRRARFRRTSVGFLLALTLTVPVARADVACPPVDRPPSAATGTPAEQSPAPGGSTAPPTADKKVRLRRLPAC